MWLGIIDVGIVDVGHRGLVWIILLFDLGTIVDGVLRIAAIEAKVVLSTVCLFFLSEGRTEVRGSIGNAKSGSAS